MLRQELHTGTIRYRPDIDGLRALAVLSVVLFHINEDLVPGGFVGVDIFFVISGYLITSIIDREMMQGRFRFAAFYKRRIRRIAPAYMVVTLVTLLAGALLLLPNDLEHLGRSALWSAFSLPNVYFWLHLDTSYFAPASDQIPLLHLWSLGVEEQFYLLWPALLLLASRFGRRWLIAMMVAGAACSFAYAQQSAASDPPFGYYMLPARAGELLLGSVVALLAIKPVEGRGVRAAVANEVLALLGYGLLGWSLFRLSGESTFPGLNALYPCVGTALLIIAGGQREGFLTALLRQKPVVWIGLISYSLYLWHWPILAFVRYFLATIDGISGLVCFAGILLFSWLSYRFVEVPFRLGSASTESCQKRDSLVPTYVFAVLALAMISGAIVLSDGLKPLITPAHGNLAQNMRAVEQGTEAAMKYPYNCQSSKLQPAAFDALKCIVGPHGPGSGQYPRAMLIGDSNAAHFVGLFGAIARERWFSFRNVTLSSCPPIFDAKDRYGGKRRNECTIYRAAIERQISRYDVIILGGQWSTYQRQHPEFIQDLERTARQIVFSGKRVIIMGQVPRFPNYDRSCEIRRLRMPVVDCQVHASKGAMLFADINAELRSIAKRTSGVYYMDVVSLVCPDGRCSPYLDGRPIYYDAGHLSMVGSWILGRRMVENGLPLRDVFRRLTLAELRG